LAAKSRQGLVQVFTGNGKSHRGGLLAAKSRQGLVQVFTGNGKGKTSAAMGAVLRAVGHGLRVYIVFFLKGKYPYGEFSVLTRLPDVEVASFGLRCLIGSRKIDPREFEEAESALAAARRAMLSGSYDLVVMDEVNVALNYKLIDLDAVIGVIKDKPPDVELVLTGRHAAPERSSCCP
jgi:cob(I)alamin adenosyltransferase